MLLNQEFADPLIWELYRHRAEAETQIRELKESYGLDGFCCEDFGATEAAFRWGCLAYNLMSLYKIALINSKHDPTLATLKGRGINRKRLKISPLSRIFC